jgi:hypothetical protein
MKKQRILFWIQVVGVLIFGSSQLYHMISYSTIGLSESMFLCNTIVVTINLVLALKAHKIQSSINTKETVLIYFFGTLIYMSFLVTMAIKAESAWGNLDWITIQIVLGLIAVMLLYVKYNNISYRNPLLKGVVSLIMKIVPQLIMAYKIYEVGGQGLSVVTLIVFHVLTLLRIYKVWETKREMTSEKNRTGLLLSEIGNEISWIVVTIVWIF